MNTKIAVPDIARLIELVQDTNLHFKDCCHQKTLENIIPVVFIDFSEYCSEYTRLQELKELRRMRIGELLQRKREIENEIELLRKVQVTHIAPFGNLTQQLKVLFSLMFEVREAISGSRKYLANRGGVSYYHLPFLRDFVLPALEKRLPENWSTNPLWGKVVDTQIVQRIGFTMERTDFREVFANLKKELSLEKIQHIVALICEEEKCAEGILPILVDNLEERAKKDGWFDRTL